MYSKHFLMKKKKHKGAYTEVTEGAENTSSSTDTRRRADEDTEFVMQGG